ncbi:hypothetical protein PG997_011289 [Apiospora hydei]|uniref:Actin-like ATPase domain-containing protein n=1 Tax=Apiospora hydei TaxID=1337664 RepID=A0ABR1VIM1_9PEZI
MASPVSVVIAFDFGTTYSGISYAFRKPGQQANPSPISKWPGDAGRVSNDVKVPTIISYNPADISDFKWGYQVKLGDKAIVGIKLLLDPDQKKPSCLPGSGKRTALKTLPKPAVDIAADYIGAVYEYAVKEIRKGSVGRFFDTCEREFVLTVPAVWSDKAKDLTLQAATKAGLGTVTMIKEPEAAAIYTLSEQTLGLQKDDIYVICDAGGGTVDLITYEVAQAYPLELAEVVPGSGGMAGAIGLNKRFEDSVRDLIGEVQMAALKSTPDGWVYVLDQFETGIKRKFSDDSFDEPYYVHFLGLRLEDDPSENLEHNDWSMKWGDLHEIFDPLVEDVIRLIDEQVQSSRKKHPFHPIKAIFLVGGFGSNSYLKTRIEKHFRDVQVIQPANAASAIMNGAVMYRLANGPKIVSRQATCHYGVKAWDSLTTLEDASKPAWLNPHTGETRVEQMEWHITIGQELNEEKIKLNFFRTFDHPYSPEQLEVEDHLYFSKAKSPPRYPDCPEVMKCCRLKTSLYPARHLMRKTQVGANNRPYWKITYDLVVTAKANLHFSLEINGKEYSSVEASYE